METTFISVVMPSYNSSKYLEKAINSVLRQSHRYLELIIIDDCSTDDSLAIARKSAEQDERVRVFGCEKNQGVAKARNLGIAAAKGKYIALIDSDDIWEEKKIETQLKLIIENKAQVGYCSYGFIDENDRQILRPFLVPKETNYKKMLVKSVISCSTAMVEATLLKEHPFDNSYYHEDYVLWMELMALPVKAVGNAEVLAHYRQVSGSRSNNKVNAAKHRWEIYRNVLNLSIIESIFVFAKYAVYGISKYFL